MDIQGSQVWKWYDPTPDNRPRMSGRSASWSSVGDFLHYVQNNEGYGLAASADAPYDTGEPGDLLHMGTEEDWRHTVIITDVIRDENGQTVDYLVASNTAELKNFPAGAYAYTRQMLIKIWGWNE